LQPDSNTFFCVLENLRLDDEQSYHWLLKIQTNNSSKQPIQPIQPIKTIMPSWQDRLAQAEQLDAQPKSFYEQTPFVRPSEPVDPDGKKPEGKLAENGVVYTDEPCKIEPSKLWLMAVDVKRAANKLHADSDMSDEQVCLAVLKQMPHTKPLYDHYEQRIYRMLVERKLDAEHPDFMRMFHMQCKMLHRKMRGEDVHKLERELDAYSSSLCKSTK